MPRLIAVLSIVWLWTLPGAAANQSNPLELDATQTLLISQINELRSAGNLGRVEVDTLRSYFVQLTMGRSIQEGYGTKAESTWTKRLGRSIPDWNKWGFMVACDSAEQVLTELEGRQQFMDALMKSDVSHIAVADAPRSEGGMWCSVWFINRLVDLGPSRVRMCYEGPTYFIVSGTSPYKQVRVRYYKSMEDPTTYKGEEDDFVEVETDKTGYFEATLPFSKFGEGEYRVIIYVRSTPEEEYRIAACSGFGPAK